MNHRHPIRRSLVVTFVVAVVVALFSGVSAPAMADTATSYDAAKARLQSLQHQSDMAVDAYNGAAQRLDALNAEVRSSEVRVDQLRGQVDENRGKLAVNARSAYKYGSSQAAAGITSFLSIGEISDLSVATKYLGNLQGDMRSNLVRFSAAKSDLDTQVSKLRKAQAQQQQITSGLKDKQREIESSIGEQTRLTTQWKSRLDAEAAAEQQQITARAAAAQRAPAAGSPTRGNTALAIAPTGGGTQAAPAASGSGAPAQSPAAARPKPKPTPQAGGGGAPAAGAGAAVAFARAQLGKPYRWGADGPDAFDCSGLTSAAWSHAGKSIPRTSDGQAGLPRVSSPAPGDIAHRPGHVGLYVGGGAVINAPHTGDVVKYGDAGRYSSFHRP